MKRRQFISTAGAAAAAGALLSNVAPLRAAGAGPPAGDIPPAYAARITPVTQDEFAARRAKAQSLMSEGGVDLLLMEGGTTMRYFSGVRWGRSERLFAMVLPASGEPFYISPKFEESRALEQVGAAKLYTWEEDVSPHALLASLIRDRGLASGTIAIEESTRFFVREGIGARLSSARIADGTPVTAECRAVKSDHELELMQVANELTAEAFAAAASELKEGMSEREFGRLLSGKFTDRGVSGGALVLFGEASAHPHGLEKPNTLKEGDIVLIDGGCSVEGYASDVTRTTVFGKPSDKMRAIHDVVYEAQTSALRASKPGVPAGEIDAAARKVIDDAGYGPDYKYFTHRLGHGIGMEGHEWFYLVRGSTRKEKPGDVHSNEPGIYIPGEFGVRIEDEMVITADGARLMLPPPEGLETMFSGR